MLVLLLTIAGCKTDTEPDAADVTWFDDVRPIVHRRCASCHEDGGVAPFVFDDVTANAMAAQLVDSVASGRMPPFGMDPGCRTVADDPRPTSEEVEILLAWRDAGFPAGEDTGQPLPSRDSAPLPEHDLIATPVEAFVPDLSSPDDYRCMSTDHVFERDTWIIGSEVLPDTLSIVHHVIAYAVLPDGAAQLAEMEAEDERPGFDCFNGRAYALPLEEFGFWVPGVQPQYQNPGGEEVAGIWVPAGSRIVLEMHYNNSNVATGAAKTDQTQLGVWTLPEGADPTHRQVGIAAWALDLDIPAGDPAAVNQSSSLWPVEGEVSSVSPHMHTLGTRIETTLQKADGTEACLGDVQYDFDWQYTYTYAPSDRPYYSPGDRVHVRCTHDNSAQNQPIVDGERSEPRDVSWGDGTFDEMCLEAPTVLMPYTAPEEEGVCAGWADCAAQCDEDDLLCLLTCATSSGGMSCLSCATEEGIWTDDASVSCGSEMMDLYGCWARCPTAGDDVYGCLIETCDTEAQAYTSCWTQAMAMGEIEDADEACPGMHR